MGSRAGAQFSSSLARREVALAARVAIACRIAFLTYSGLVTVLLLAPDPLNLLGLKRHAALLPRDRGGHALLFLGLALLAAASRWPVSRTVLAALLVGYALATEALQGAIPPRTPDWADLLENLLGIAVGLSICWGVGGRFVVRQADQQPPASSRKADRDPL